MALFNLPTSARKPDSYAQALRFDEVNPTSAVAPGGGGAVTFELQSPANNWFIPKLSYFDVRLTVTKPDAAGTGTTALAATDGSATHMIQFAEYPASHLVQTFSHSINGANLETVSECAELSAIQMRTMLPYDYHETFGESFRLGLAGDTKANSTTTAPGGALQPWGSGITTFSCKYQPPAALFKYAGSIPGLRQRMVLTLTNDLYKAVVGSVSGTTAARTTYTVSIDSIKFYACHVIPEQPIAPPSTVVLSLPMHSVVKQYTAGSSSTQTFSVAPSTDKIYVCKNSNTAGDGTTSNAAHMFHSDIKAVEMSYAGQRSPNIAYTGLESGNAERDNLRAFVDFANTTGFLYRSQGMPNTLLEWQNRPIYGASFEKPANDASTSLIVRTTCGATDADKGNIVVAYRHHKAVVIRYSADGLAETVDVQENLM